MYVSITTGGLAMNVAVFCLLVTRRQGSCVPPYTGVSGVMKHTFHTIAVFADHSGNDGWFGRTLWGLGCRVVWSYPALSALGKRVTAGLPPIAHNTGCLPTGNLYTASQTSTWSLRVNINAICPDFPGSAHFLDLRITNAVKDLA
jgi:hypothetical protein